MFSFYKHYCCEPHELSFVNDCVSCVYVSCVSRVSRVCTSRVSHVCIPCVCVPFVCPMCVSCVCMSRVCPMCALCVFCVCVCPLTERTWSGGGSRRTGAVLPSQGGGSQGTGGKVGAHTCPAPSPHSFIQRECAEGLLSPFWVAASVNSLPWSLHTGGGARQ